MDKRCPTCGETKPIRDFYPDKGRHGGRTARCRECHRTHVRQWSRERNFPPTGTGRRVCTGCGEEKDTTEFYPHPKKKDGISSRCKRCERDSGFRSRYGIGMDDYETMLAEQGGVCAICGEPPKQTGRVRRLAVDHDHTSGGVRGLLCSSCNLRLAALEDTLWVTKAEGYLRSPRGRTSSQEHGG